ncbi:hypothetical protein GQ44DRAFT_436921 [Phaeosphaeriaceae sp. PMI808]|nr:hypothetical protein GQ44DRAFT_436921 [Phaeosphaeriaceae sp. PMI808]
MKEEAEAAVEAAKGVLQELVVVVSLVRTLTESFGSASDLYRKLKQKSKSDSHSSSDKNVQREKRRLRPMRKRRSSSSSSDSNQDQGHRRHISWNLGASKEDYSDSDEEAVCTSSSQVLAEYDRGYRKLGEGFARGDLVTQNQLQAQIIHLQRTLLSIHQDYMLSTYLSPTSSHSHLLHLIQTTRSARASSIQALHMQYRRMLSSTKPTIPDPYQTIPGAFPMPSDNIPHHDSKQRRPSSKNRGRDRSRSPDSNGSGEINIQPYPNPPSKPSLPLSSNRKLFCVYARDLQEHSHLPLTDNYKSGGDNMCPFCHARVNTRPGKAWEIITHSCKEGDRHERRVFLVKNRFAIKCHRQGSGFACVLCAECRDSDTVCREVEALMDHLWKDHTGDELERDDDIVEIDE